VDWQIHTVPTAFAMSRLSLVVSPHEHGQQMEMLIRVVGHPGEIMGEAGERAGACFSRTAYRTAQGSPVGRTQKFRLLSSDVLPTRRCQLLTTGQSAH
jgi:hypothetical protein